MMRGRSRWPLTNLPRHFSELFRTPIRLPSQLQSFLWRGFMKKIGIMIFVVALVVGLVVTNMFSFGRVTGNFFNFSLNFGGVHGSGNVATDKRSVSGFKAVEVGGVFQVEITAQKDFA